MTSTRSDTLVGDDVVRALGSNPHTRQVLAKVSNGDVTLRGNVVDASASQEAESLVNAIPGVRKVINQLNIDDGSASFGERGQAVRDNPDGRDDAKDGEQDLQPDG